jgi:hypothetical protein
MVSSYNSQTSAIFVEMCLSDTAARTNMTPRKEQNSLQAWHGHINDTAITETVCNVIIMRSDIKSSLRYRIMITSDGRTVLTSEPGLFSSFIRLNNSGN